MSNQTTVDLRIAKATPGLIADIHHGNQIVSAAVESATIGFGLVVSRGTDDDVQAVVGGDANGILGISVRELGREAASIGATSLTYVQGESMSVMRDGFIYATCVAGCSAGDAVKFVNATGALSAGAAAAGETVIVGAEWMETVAAGAVAKLRLEVNGLTAGS